MKCYSKVLKNSKNITPATNFIFKDFQNISDFTIAEIPNF